MSSPRFLPLDQILLLATLWTLYGAIHSALASRAAKRFVAQHWPAVPRAYRLGFNALAVLLLIPPAALTHALGDVPLWAWTGVFAWVANGTALLALAGLVWSTRHYDMREFLGIAQWQAGTGDVAHAPAPALRISPLHRFVRHPWYFLALLLLWTRDMDAARLVSAAVITLYLWIGSRLEERKLVAELGERYARYRRRVPGLVPLPWRHLSRSEAEALAAVPHNRGDGAFRGEGGGV